MSSCLRAENINLVVPDRVTPILQDINIQIFAEEFVIIVGHNGSGKSSLVKILSGERQASTGHVFIDNEPLSNLSLEQKAVKLINISQAVNDMLFLELSLEENITLWESRFKPALRNTAQHIASLTSKSEKLTQNLTQQVRNLSGGEKQLFLLALMLSHPPDILFLDEATSALDPKVANEIMQSTEESIKKHKITTIMITHNLDYAIAYGNRLIVLNDGRITYDQIKPKNFTLSELKTIMES